MADFEREDELLRAVALKNAQAILLARKRAEEELVRAKEALRESQERLQAALSAAGMGTFRWDLRRDVVDWDDNLHRLLGLDSEGPERSLERFLAAVHPDDRAMVARRYERCAQEGVDLDLELRVVWPDGGVRWIHDKGKTAPDAEGNPASLTGACVDITELKELLESERAARAAAERMSELKDEFLATLSHELRTPLNAIVGWAAVLRQGSKSPEDLARGLETIDRNARLQAQLIDELLDMSRINSGKMRLDVQSLHPASFIETAVESMRPAAQAKGIRLSTVLDPLAGPISGDPGRLQQVMWNLLSNAIKFTPKGGRVQVLLERVDSYVEISVADTGMGIPPELVEHLFDRFRQADSSASRKHSGLGIGLSIVKRLVELHGGNIRVISPGEDQGTTVTVQLPLQVAHRSSPAEEQRNHPQAPSPAPLSFVQPDLQGLTVLVVDDHDEARELIKRVLEDCHAEVVTASSAQEAIEAVASARPDLLLSDIGMPDVDGYELLRRVRALETEPGRRIPAIALTAFARPEDRTRALRTGFRAHLAKPVDPAELVATVASVVDRIVP